MAIATHTNDILSCGEPDLLLKARPFMRTQFGKVEVQTSFGHVGHGICPEDRFLRDASQLDFTRNAKFLPGNVPAVAGRSEGAPVNG